MVMTAARWTERLGLALAMGSWLVAGGCSDDIDGLRPPPTDAAVIDAPANADLAERGMDVGTDVRTSADTAVSYDVALDLPIDRAIDVAIDVAIDRAIDVAIEVSSPGQDAGFDVQPFDTSATDGGGIVCRSAPGLFACMWDDTITLEKTWLVSQDMTVHGTVTRTMLSAGANWCSVPIGLTAEAQANTQSLSVRDDSGHLWYPQYYVQSSRIPWRVGDTIDIRYQTTVAADGRPRRAMTLSSGGRVVVYVAEAVTLEDLTPAPVALRLGPTACPSVGECGGGRYGLLAGAAGIPIPYGKVATVEGYAISNADCADVTSSCDRQPSRISVAMVLEPAVLDAGLD